MTDEAMQKSVEIFISYAREDEELLNRLEKHLAVLKQQGFIKLWHNRNINAGAEWEREVDQHLNKANIILLLISAEFIGSDYCYSGEMLRAMERHKRGEARVIPIILRPVFWQGAPFDKLQMLPTDAKPVRGSNWWHSEDEALKDIVEGIRKAVEAFMTLQKGSSSLENAGSDEGKNSEEVHKPLQQASNDGRNHSQESHNPQQITEKHSLKAIKQAGMMLQEVSQTFSWKLLGRAKGTQHAQGALAIMGSLILLSFMTFASYYYFSLPPNIVDSPRSATVNPAQYPPVDGMSCQSVKSYHTYPHIHMNLVIYIEGTQETVPANIGVKEGCIYEVTSTRGGFLNVRTDHARIFTLGSFLNLWATSEEKYPNQLNGTAGWQAYISEKGNEASRIDYDYHTIQLNTSHLIISLLYHSPNVQPTATINWGDFTP